MASAKERMAKWRKKNPEREKQSQRHAAYMKTYGLSVSQVDNLMEKQGGRCAVCGEKETALGKNKKVRRLAIDHCHDTGKVRGLLCYRCNYVLGLCRDNINILLGLARYVEFADTGLRIHSDPMPADAMLQELLIWQ